MDLARAEADLNGLIERRAGERNAANELQAMYEASARRHREKLRRANRAAWFSHFSALADSLRRSAEEYERRAEALLEGGEGGG